MFNKIIHFIKYNNAVVFIFLLVFLIGSGVFAQSETGKEFIGQKQTRQEGVDNTLLLEADLDTLDMDFQIEKIEEDEFYYYVTYTYLDLVKKDEAWQYEMQEKVRKVTKLLKRDLGDYIAEELEEQYLARIKDLKKEKRLASESGQSKRVELSEYDGLIGQSLRFASKVVPGYEAVKKNDIPSPALPSLLSLKGSEEKSTEEIEDSITEVYNNYIAEMDPDQDDVFGTLDNCPLDKNPSQADKDGDGIGDVCDYVDDTALAQADELEGDASSTEPSLDSDASSSVPVADNASNKNASSTQDLILEEDAATSTSDELPSSTDPETDLTKSGSVSNEDSKVDPLIDGSVSNADENVVIEETQTEETVEIIDGEDVEIIEIN